MWFWWGFGIVRCAVAVRGRRDEVSLGVCCEVSGREQHGVDEVSARSVGDVSMRCC